jgi:hypothetical protein
MESKLTYSTKDIVFGNKIITDIERFPSNGLVARWTFENSLTDMIGGYTLTSDSNTISRYRISKIGNGLYSANNLTQYSYWNTTNTTLLNILSGRNPFTTSSFVFAFTNIWVLGAYPLISGLICNNGYYLGIDNANSNTFYYYPRSGGSIVILTGNTSGWYHLVLRYDGSVTTCFINNIIVYSATETASISISDLGLEGQGQTTITDNTYLYNRALSDSEVAQLWNGGWGI